MILKVQDESGTWHLWDNIQHLDFGEARVTFHPGGDEPPYETYEKIDKSGRAHAPRATPMGNPSWKSLHENYGPGVKVEESTLIAHRVFFERENSWHNIIFNTGGFILNDHGDTIERLRPIPPTVEEKI